MDISIIIVNYKSADLIINCIKSFVSKQAIHLEVIVVDNNSQDDSENRIRSLFPDVKWIQMGYNSGFARANNAGIRVAAGKVILLLNPDTLEVDNAIEKTYNLFVNTSYVACGVQLLNSDGSSQISGNYAMKGGLNYLLPLPYVGSCVKWLGQKLGIRKPNVPEAGDVVEVDWINGAFLMVKQCAIEKAGVFDEDFFLYSEEAEWCSRLKKVGKLCIFGSYHVIHLQGETSNAIFESVGKGYYNIYDKKGLQIVLSNFVRIRKQFGVAWFLIMLFIYTITVPLLWLLPFFENIFRIKNPFSHFALAKGFTENIVSLWFYAVRIIRNNPFFYKVL